MGINTAMARFMARARKLGTELGDVVTIGRQSLTVPEADLAAIARFLGIDEAAARTVARDHYAERLLTSVYGARSTCSIDVSAYEDADILHDLNLPIPATLAGRFDTLIDAGTIEHLFDQRTVLTSYMALVRQGGSIFLQTNANNLCGHGFYQLSPELLYRVFAPANGFEVREMILVETPLIFVERSRSQRAYRVVDPATVGKRVQLTGGRPTTIAVHARKTASVEPFTQPVIQSSYAVEEPRPAGTDPDTTRDGDRALGEAFHYLSPLEELRRRLAQARRHGLRNRRYYRPWRMDDAAT